VKLALPTCHRSICSTEGNLKGSGCGFSRLALPGVSELLEVVVTKAVVVVAETFEDDLMSVGALGSWGSRNRRKMRTGVCHCMNRQLPRAASFAFALPLLCDPRWISSVKKYWRHEWRSLRYCVGFSRIWNTGGLLGMKWVVKVLGGENGHGMTRSSEYQSERQRPKYCLGCFETYGNRFI
jgi:hypothetical protein